MKFTFINFVVTYKRAILSKSTRHFTSGVKSLVSSKPSYYSVLEIDSKATQKEVKEAFLKLTKKWHPDVHASTGEVSQKKAEENFRDVVSAFETLSDPKKRSIYDEEIGIGRPQPFQGVPQNPQNVHQWSPGRQAPTSGVDPDWGRPIEIDLSEERMKKAWEAYKKLWDVEGENRKKLEEKKLHFRIFIDKKREMYEYLNEEERNSLKESMRTFRNPNFSKDSLWEDFLKNYDTKSASGKKDKSENKAYKSSNSYENRRYSSPFSERLSNEQLKQKVKEESERLQKSFQKSDIKKGPSSKLVDFKFEDLSPPSEKKAVPKRDNDEEDEDIDRDFLFGDFKPGTFDYEKNEDPLSGFGSSKSNPLHELRDTINQSRRTSQEKFGKPFQQSQSTNFHPSKSDKDGFSRIKSSFSEFKTELKDYELLSDAKHGGKNSGMRSEYKISPVGFALAVAVFLIFGALNLSFWEEIHNIDRGTSANYNTVNKNSSSKHADPGT